MCELDYMVTSDAKLTFVAPQPNWDVLIGDRQPLALFKTLIVKSAIVFLLDQK